MKNIFLFLSIILTVYRAHAKEKTYTGSSPADKFIRSFLGIPLSDSVDFVRWNLMLRNNRYHLQCHYGIGKANTYGFVNGGAKITLAGEFRKEKNYYRLQNRARFLKVVQINEDLLHLSDDHNRMLVGNGGWSYTLNSINPKNTDEVSVSATSTPFKDSISFHGRTPCNVPGIITNGKFCYKIKWYIVLYSDPYLDRGGKFRIAGTPWRKEGSKTGSWRIVTDRKGRTIYQLTDANGTEFLHLLKLDERILVFTDAKGKLLVGDEDFSYTLNRRP